jgi:hypothetical protein
MGHEAQAAERRLALHGVREADRRAYPATALHLELTDCEPVPPEVETLLARLAHGDTRLTWALVADPEADPPTAPFAAAPDA